MYAAAMATASTRARPLCTSSARSAQMPPAPTPATMPVTASTASVETMIPTMTDAPMARSTALGGFVCSDRNASVMKTKGMSARPKAMGGPAAGASLASDTAATRPISVDQKATASTMVAIVIARHLRWGGSGSSPAVERGFARSGLIPSPSRR